LVFSGPAVCRPPRRGAPAGSAGQATGRAAVGRARELAMQIIILQPLVALIAGILILVFPRLLNYIVAVYLILIGLVGLAGQLV
jgi:hypothetical protein